MDNFAKFKEQVIQDLSFSGTTSDTMGDFFSLLSDIENLKKMLGDIHLMNKLKISNTKLEDLVKGACEMMEKPAPKNLPTEEGQSISDRVNVSVRLIKELGKTLGIDHEETQESSPAKFQHHISLNFDPFSALAHLIAVSYTHLTLPTNREV